MTREFFRTYGLQRDLSGPIYDARIRQLGILFKELGDRLADSTFRLRPFVVSAIGPHEPTSQGPRSIWFHGEHPTGGSPAFRTHGIRSGLQNPDDGGVELPTFLISVKARASVCFQVSPGPATSPMAA